MARGPTPLGASLVSSDKCCSDSGGGGDFSTIPVGVLWKAYCGDATGMLPDVGLAYRLAVTGVTRGSPTEDAVDADEVVRDVSELVPSLLSDFGAGGAK